jgi:hypothetical protein
MHRNTCLAAALAVTLAAAGVADGQEWGDLEGTIAYKGKPPVPAPIKVDKDPQFCGKHKLVDEQIMVNSANGGLANVVVYLFTKPAKIHPDYEKVAKEDVVIDNENCRFAPHVATMRTTQKLVVGNKDPGIGHNTKADFFQNPAAAFNVTIPTGGKIEKQFMAAEASPAKLECSIHPWMNAYLLIREDPYAAVTDKDGKFTIKNLPVGEHTFKVWHQNGFLSNVTVNGKATMWSRGAMKMTIKPGMNSLGKVEATPPMR